MSAEQASLDPRWIFQVALNHAVTTGEISEGAATLGPMTKRAIGLVSMTHPDASADDIADAFSAFDLEHGQGSTAE